MINFDRDYDRWACTPLNKVGHCSVLAHAGDVQKADTLFNTKTWTKEIENVRTAAGYP
jgi:hypothetical protein